MSAQLIANRLARPKRQVFGYLLAMASVGLAFVTARTFLHFHLPLAIMSFSFCAIAITFWYGGIGPGILALVLAVVIRTFYFQPEVDWISRVTYDFVFVLFSFFMLQATRAKNELESRVAKRTAALTKANEDLHLEVVDRTRAEQAVQESVTALKKAFEDLATSRAYLAEAQALSHTGSAGWNVSTGELVWSEETFRIFGYDRSFKPTLQRVLERVHPEDLLRVQEALDAASRNGKIDLENRVLMPDGSIKQVHIVGHAVNYGAGEVAFIGAVMDVTATRNAFEEIRNLRDQLYKENLALREEIDIARMFEEIVGSSPALQAVLSKVAKVAPTDSTVLVTGETGTGKELIARAIHKRSLRSSRAFVSVNCAAIPRDLIASELFGHEKGAFTGATQRRLGRFESADGGTIFLDEIGELPAEMQIALLRVLQEREFQRVGGNESIKSDVRVVAATNRDLQAAIAEGKFREDLFYRLNVFPIEVPPLRERREDIPLLVEYFVDRYATQAGKKITGISKKSMELLQSYAWPGNIRELQNVIERSVIISDLENLSIDESWLGGRSATTDSAIQPFSEKLAAQEREMIESALAESNGRVSGPRGAAAKLGIPQSTLDSKIKALKINKHRFRRA